MTKLNTQLAAELLKEADFDSLHPMLTHLVLARLACDYARAEDFASQALEYSLTQLANGKHFADGKHFRASTVLKCQALVLDHLKQLSKRGKHSHEDTETLSAQPTEAHRDVREALSLLSEAQRKLLLAVHEQGSRAVAAGMLGCSRATAYRRIAQTKREAQVLLRRAWQA